MRNKEINISCYADDAALIAENEDDLQRLLLLFNKVAQILVKKMYEHIEDTFKMRTDGGPHHNTSENEIYRPVCTYIKLW